MHDGYKVYTFADPMKNAWSHSEIESKLAVCMTFVVDTQKNRLNETILLSTLNRC